MTAPAANRPCGAASPAGQPSGGEKPLIVSYHAPVQTRYLILAALLTGLAIIAAAAIWFLQL